MLLTHTSTSYASHNNCFYPQGYFKIMPKVRRIGWLWGVKIWPLTWFTQLCGILNCGIQHDTSKLGRFFFLGHDRSVRLTGPFVSDHNRSVRLTGPFVWIWNRSAYFLTDLTGFSGSDRVPNGPSPVQPGQWPVKPFPNRSNRSMTV